MPREDANGQLLALFPSVSKTFYCPACNRDIANRYRVTHPSTKAHTDALVRDIRPTRKSYRAALRRERVRPSAYAFHSVEDNDDALENYYRECAIEDGTADTIMEEYGS